MEGRSEIKQAEIAALIIRADGTKEDRGVVSYWHRRWYRRAYWRFRQWLPS